MQVFIDVPAVRSAHCYSYNKPRYFQKHELILGTRAFKKITKYQTPFLTPRPQRPNPRPVWHYVHNQTDKRANGEMAYILKLSMGHLRPLVYKL